MRYCRVVFLLYTFVVIYVVAVAAVIAAVAVIMSMGHIPFPDILAAMLIIASAAIGIPIELMIHFGSDFFMFQKRSDDCIHTSVKNAYARK